MTPNAKPIQRLARETQSNSLCFEGLGPLSGGQLVPWRFVGFRGVQARIPEGTLKGCAGRFLEPGWPNLEEITGLKDFPNAGREAPPRRATALTPTAPSLPPRAMAKKAKKAPEEEAPKKGKKSAAKK